MARSYASFLIRCWRLDGDERRIKIEHIQTGEGTQVTTLEAALVWLTAHMGQPPDDSAAEMTQPDPAAGDDRWEDQKGSAKDEAVLS